MERSFGILMPIFSLPSKYGIGDFGKESYKFVDFLQKSGAHVWQILPLVQTGYGNSPYSSVSSTSFNPYFISPELLKEQGLITASELKFALSENRYIDYGTLYAVRYPLLRKAFSRFDKTDKDFKRYLSTKESLSYALFMSIKYASGQKNFYEWDEPLKRREQKALNKFHKDYKDEVLFWQFVQYMAKRQWQALKKYANSKNVLIMGDMPLYVALDSVDVWTHPELFKLDNDFRPTKVAGVPPDYFCEDGQLWGNPVYNYDVHKLDNFSWWAKRVESALKLYDFVRIDHFRALDRYYEIDADKPNAKVGEWVKVPSDELFNSIHAKVDKSRIIAEDLGIIDDGVRELLKKNGYSGMKILSFAFNGDENNLYLPERLGENCVCYTGTHDNDTLMGLIENSSPWDYENLVRGVKNSAIKMNLSAKIEDNASLANAIIELGFKSQASLYIMPYQDVLNKGSDFRINEPGSIKEQNWAVEFNKSHLNAKISKELKTLCVKYNR